MSEPVFMIRAGARISPFALEGNGPRNDGKSAMGAPLRKRAEWARRHVNPIEGQKAQRVAPMTASGAMRARRWVLVLSCISSRA